MKTLAARHPWVRAGSIERIEGEPTDGGEVDLYSHKGRFIGRGLYNGRSRLRVRLYRWDAPAALDQAFWEERIARAVRLRKMIGYDDPHGAARVVYSEGDGLSGLIVDRYRDYLVVQVTGLGIAQRIDTFLDILERQFSPKGILLRTEPSIAKAEGLHIESGTVRGKAPEGPILIEENGVTFGVDLVGGHKTGFYLDQRENRAAAARYMKKRRVLDVFCYTGGFAVTAARLGGAREVLGIDGAADALLLAKLNARQNAVSQVRFEQGDAFKTLESLASTGERFDAVILDPPKFARSRKQLREALKAYHWLNRLGVSVLEPGGVLVTCSCSGSVTQEDFIKMLYGVA
ncbi:MAG: class I SAM-dependent rRNA methyltransferase, partial [Planctomycetota bacterium]